MKQVFSPMVAGALVLFSASLAVHGADTDLSDVPLVTSSSSEVRANLMFILDDSGSMDDDFLPDWADPYDNDGNWSGTNANAYRYRNASFNGVAYNPAIRYLPPVYFSSTGADDTTTYPTMSGTSTSTGRDSSTTPSGPNWKYLKRDGYGVQSTSRDNIEDWTSHGGRGGAWFFTTVAGEWCTSPNLRNCSTTQGGGYIYEARLRWCTSSALTTCKGTNDSDYDNPRHPMPFRATITFSHTSTSSNSTSVTGILVNGFQILSAPTTGSTTPDTVASRVAANINACEKGFPTGSACQVAGYVATVSGATVTITGIDTTTAAPVVSLSGGADPMVATASVFTGQVVPGTTVTAPGGMIRTVIHPGRNSYPYPGQATKDPGRSDCAGSTCTYLEEMQNYANWYSYYRTRMQTMKTAASNAFATFGEVWDANKSPPGLVNKKPLRVGFFTINSAKNVNATGTGFLNAGEFSFPHKKNFYDKLFAANPSGYTPLRGALSKVGRYYANKLSGQIDPVQYSCQRNVALLSTDGYWNTNNEDSSYGPKKLNNSDNVGNQDGSEPRPFNDGATSTQTATTPTTTIVRKQVVQTETTTTVQRRTSYSWSAYGNPCSSSRHRRIDQPQQRTRTLVVTTTTIQDETTVSTRVVVTVNGTVTSDTTTPETSTATVSTTPVTDSDVWTAWANQGAPTYQSCTTSTTLPNPNPSNGTTISNNTVTTAGPTTTVISTNGPTTGTTTTVISPPTGGVEDSLADIAQYYYGTDLRTSALSNCLGVAVGSPATQQDVCVNNVKQGRGDQAAHQHLTTYTLGLGVNGLMTYLPGYQSKNFGDYYDLGTAGRSASLSSDANAVCPWMVDGERCTWPTPASWTQTAIDDLWHAGVNGRGAYFSAGDPQTLVTSLADALSSIEDESGSSAAATTSNPNVTSGDNFVFESTFTESSWDGELVRRRLNLYTGAVLPTVDWSARTLLNARSWSGRDVWTRDNGGSANAAKKKAFDWAQLTSAEKAYFALSRLQATGGLTQFCASGSVCLSPARQTAAAGEPLVNFIRGDRANEGDIVDDTTYFRLRDYVLGDIVSAEAVYVKAPLQDYQDKGYAAYRTAQASRQGVVYVAANDGMLHAFNADTGAEIWAHIPSFVIPNLYQLADKNYKNQHKFLLDGTPVVGDICTGGCGTDGATWATILVGGQNKGGRNYYALDITDPANPKSLWEFGNTNLGYSYGNPVITKLKSGEWVVMFASGYNNTSPGDGQGRLFILDAYTGALKTAISGGSIATSADVTSGPSGLARISAWADAPMKDNTALRVYGGDLLGNLWRFDINGDIGNSGYEATLLATLRDASNRAQPITEAPQLGSVEGYAGVFVGTGRYLGVSDAGVGTQQSFYGIKDSLNSSGYGNPRTATTFVGQTMTETTCPSGAVYCSSGQTVRIASTSGAPATTGTADVNWSQKNGWYLDFANTNERSYTDAQLVQGSLIFTTNVPEVSACTSGGSSFLYYLNYQTGGAVPGAGTLLGLSLGNSLATRPVAVQLPTGDVVVLTRSSGGNTVSTRVPISPPPGATRRISWRELNVE